TASGFPPNTSAQITVNGTVLTDSIPIDNSGGLTFQLDTGLASTGEYLVTARASQSQATASFWLGPSYPVRAQDGSGTILHVPQGIAFTHLVYFPLAGS